MISKIQTAGVVIATTLALTASPIASPTAAVENPRPIVKLALCLDTSGSMDGLIESAKQKLWAVVNDLALAEPAPVLEVALLTFGNDGHNPESGWVDVQTPFTDDLDLVSERLFALRTNGGTEYVGRVLYRAGGLEWGEEERALRLAVVAGNESADQDQTIRYESVCADLKGRGIIVNSIYCGEAEDTIAPGWREVARLAGGAFASIDQNDGMVVIPTPYDDRLGELSEALNGTYIPMGAKGEAGAANQSAQDANAAKLNSSAKAARAKTKASSLYSCAWDLIDACRSGDLKVEEIEAEDLPEALQSLSTGELAAHIEKVANRRTELQAQVQELSVKRDRFIAEEMKKRSIDESRSFDHAIREAVRRQAEAIGFRFPESNAPEMEKQTRMLELEGWELAAVKQLVERAQVVKKGAEHGPFQNASVVTMVPDLFVSFSRMEDWQALTGILHPGRPGVTQLSAKELSVRLDDRLVLFVLEDGC